MLSPQLLNLLDAETSSAVFSGTENPCVEHFGDLDSETQALAESAVVCPLQEFVRIQVTGKDRAKFLHNFCTNNINDLPAGKLCEAFFTDVKAKVLAHGYILAGTDSHEIWMLPGDETAILNHLNRYIITEDVTVESLPGEWQTLAILGPRAADVLSQADGMMQNLSPGEWTATEAGVVLLTEWNQVPLAYASVSAEKASYAWQSLLDAGATASGSVVFHHQRILEGFPVVGVDIDNGNLAPEADRNAIAISYTKGCYLGQEPIARIDAMGHVNRRLFRVAVVSEGHADTGATDLPVISSLSQVPDTHAPALIMLSVGSVKQSEMIEARTVDGVPVVLRKSGD